jgi:hypothetical protein
VIGLKALDAGRSERPGNAAASEPDSCKISKKGTYLIPAPVYWLANKVEARRVKPKPSGA